MIVIGADIWNGTPSQLSGFKNLTGATFPLLLNAGTTTGGNLATAYYDRDNYVIIDEQGTERYSARQQGYSYGGALDVPRMRALVDSLLAHPVGVGDPGSPTLAAPLTVWPNPFRELTRIDAALPSGSGAATEIAVLDLTGRRLVTLSVHAVSAGSVQATWNGRDAAGRPLPPGLYLVRAAAGRAQTTRRVVLLR